MVEEILKILSQKFILSRGSIDDEGARRYSVGQNVPDQSVVILQTALLMAGYGPGSLPDGAFGSKTKYAVQYLQRCFSDRFEKIDGVASKELYNLLKELLIRRPFSHRFNFGCGIFPVPFYSQGDSRWAPRILGKNRTIKQSGCLVTCLAMLGAYLKDDPSITPGLLDIQLDAVKGYMNDSIVWDKALKLIDCEYGHTHERTYSTESVIKNLAKGLPSIIRVDYGIDAGLQYNHFVLAIGCVQDEIIVHDPATCYGDGIKYIEKNVLSKIDRKNGYTPVLIDFYKVLK